jgi:type II secretory pathway pseudopilin PulG
MTSRRHHEAGETLVEILITLVVMGLVVSAFFAAISTNASLTKAQQDSVTADALLRNFAETTKQAVRTTCLTTNSGAVVTVTLTPLPPSGFNVAATAPVTCPSPATVNQVNITATLPGGTTKLLSIVVRTP